MCTRCHWVRPTPCKWLMGIWRLCPAAPSFPSLGALGWACFLSLSSPSVFFLQDFNIVMLKKKQPTPPSPHKKPIQLHLQMPLKDLKDVLMSGRSFFFLIIFASKCNYFLELLLWLFEAIIWERSQPQAVQPCPARQSCGALLSAQERVPHIYRYA